MAAANVHTFTDDNFATEVKGSDLPVLVDFWAIWCGPCRAVGPVVEQLADEYAGRLKVGKVDVDANPNIAMEYNIRSIPALMVFKGGEVVETAIGARPKAALAALVDRHV